MSAKHIDESSILSASSIGENVNKLEKALASSGNYDLDFYLEVESTDDIRRDIEDIKQKAICNTDSGLIKQKLQELIDNI